jgi:hypothetical protein
LSPSVRERVPADLLAVLGWYVVAKVCEDPLDRPLFAVGGWVSGHTRKHLAAEVGAFWLLRMPKSRRPVAAPAEAMAAPR